jgi:hypothetical protein
VVFCHHHDQPLSEQVTERNAPNSRSAAVGPDHEGPAPQQLERLSAAALTIGVALCTAAECKAASVSPLAVRWQGA